MTYIHLKSEDTKEVKSLMQVFAEAFEDPKAYPSNHTSPEYIHRLLSNQANIIIVAVDESGHVVGGLIAYELQKFEKERSEIYLWDLAVLESHRRKGIATGLISHLKVIARERGVKMIFVQAENIDQPAIKLYTKLSSGILEGVTHFEIST